MLLNGLILLGLSLAWASDNLFISWVDHDLPPLTAAAAITLAGAVSLALFVRAGMRRPLLPVLRAQPALTLAMAVTAVALPQLAIVAAEDSISPGLTSVVGTAVPLLTFLAAAFIVRTTPADPLRLLGVLAGAAGILVFAGGAGLLDQRAELAGIAVMTAGACVFVVNGLYVAARARDLDQYVLSVWVVAFAALGLIAVALAAEGVPDRAPPPLAFVSIGLLGAVGIGAAYLCYFLLLARAGASFTSLYAFLVPPFGVLCDVLFAEGRLTMPHIVGVAIVLAGLWLVVNGGLRRPAEAPSSPDHGV